MPMSGQSATTPFTGETTAALPTRRDIIEA